MRGHIDGVTSLGGTWIVGSRRGSGLLAAALMIVIGANPALAQEDWYIPKRPEVLEPRQYELGLRSQFTTDSEGALDSQEFRLIPSLRATPVDRFEVYVEAPLAFAEQERIVDFEIETHTHEGLGDVFTQLTYELARGDDWAVLPSLDISIPTGRNPYEHPVGTGSGHYRYTPGVTGMKMVDPVVLFAYAGYQVSRSRAFEDIGRVKPGESLRLRIGGAFHLNPRIRASLFTATDIQGRSEIGGERIDGSGGNAVRFGAGVDWRVRDETSLNFNAIFGATDRAPDAVLTAGVTYEF